MKRIGILILFFLNVGGLMAQLPSTGLVACYLFNGNANDQSENKLHASIIKAQLTNDRFGEMNKAYAFNGIDQYIQIPDQASLSISTTGQLSISVWLKPDSLNFVKSENNYVHWMGKGMTNQQEWTFRMYNLDSQRPNRMSCYAFNLSGGLGAGSYVEEPIAASEWIHLVAIYDYGSNQITLYKNGRLVDTDSFSGYNIHPKHGLAPLRIGTRDFNSFFRGAIDDIQVYNRILSNAEVQQLFNAK
jgi:hypothetical protein